jgi:DNA-binding NarL/FixJ family response regulator
MPLPGVGLADLVRGTEADDPEVREGADIRVQGEALLGLLEARQRAGPTVVAIDDLQWLDAPSARAIRFALRRLESERVGVLTTIRDDTERPDPLEASRLFPPDRLHVLDVGPLDRDELRQVLGSVVSSISRPMLNRIYEVSGGNPLYAIELARSVSSHGEVTSADELTLPTSLTAAIAARLRSQPREVGLVVRALAVSGPVSVDELRGFVDVTDLDGALEAAAQAGLLVVDDRLQVGFAHPLLGSVEYERMSAIERRAMHGRLAERLEDPDARARHLARSVAGPDAAAAELLEEAATRASERGSSELAAEFIGHSVRLTPSDRPEEILRRSLVQVGALAGAGEVSRALALADDVISRVPPGVGRAEALIARANLEHDDLTHGEELLEQALSDAGDDRLLRGRVLDMLGWLLGMFRGDLRRGIACSKEALEIARQVGDSELEMSAAAGLAHLELQAANPMPDEMQRALAIEAEAGRSLLWAGPRPLRVAQLRMAGALADARRLSEEVYRETIASGNERWRPYSLYQLASIEVYAGDLRKAERLVAQALEAARDTDDAHVEEWIRFCVAQIQAWTGRGDDARETADAILRWADARGERPAIARTRALLGLLALSEGRPQAAVSELAAAAELVREMGFHHPASIPAEPDAIEALSLNSDVDDAEDLLGDLERSTARLHSPLVDATIERARASLLLARGSTDDAAEHFRAAARSFDELGFAPEAARAMLGLGRARLRAGQRSRAAEALAEARDRFAAMGASAWAALAARDLDRAAPGRSEGELTATEQRVAALVAEGMKNREIAGALYVSIATVEAHLTRVYRKLGIRSRSELVRLISEGSVDLTPSIRPPVHPRVPTGMSRAIPLVLGTRSPIPSARRIDERKERSMLTPAAAVYIAGALTQSKGREPVLLMGTRSRRTPRWRRTTALMRRRGERLAPSATLRTRSA